MAFPLCEHPTPHVTHRTSHGIEGEGINVIQVGHRSQQIGNPASRVAEAECDLLGDQAESDGAQKQTGRCDQPERVMP